MALALSVLAFICGVIVGFIGAEINTYIDFCSDVSSGRYIRDAQIRKEACD
jgi:hypothetical protein